MMRVQYPLAFDPAGTAETQRSGHTQSEPYVSTLLLSAVCLISFLICATTADAGDIEIKGQSFSLGETIYKNPMSTPDDLDDWYATHGNPTIKPSPDNEGMLRIQSDEHFFLWNKQIFSDRIAISYDFMPIARKNNRGLAMIWCSVTGPNGEEIRTQTGNMNGMRVAYFRRNKYNKEVFFNMISFRKYWHGNNPTMGYRPDPIPSPQHVIKPFRIRMVKHGPYVEFSIHDRVNGDTVDLLEWKDDGSLGKILKGGRLGFRQMRGLVADYNNFKVQRVKKD